MDERVNIGDPYDQTVDIYALGMIFYAIFTGEGIYDNCGTPYSIENKRKEVNAGYPSKMLELVAGIP